VYNESTRKELSNIFEMHFIEIGKFNKNYKNLNNTLDRWIAFLNKAYEIDVNKIPQQLLEDKAVKKAIEKLDIMYLDSEERELYENDLKRMRIQKAELKTAERKGKSSKAIEIAKNLLDVLDVEIIARKTGLDVEFINELKNKK
jgi:predicted transposase/invertase (TIGR01784 family)